jgi:hypothetical protein
LQPVAAQSAMQRMTPITSVKITSSVNLARALGMLKLIVPESPDNMGSSYAYLRIQL